MKNAKSVTAPIAQVRFFSIVPHETHIDFLGKRYIGFALSAVLVLLGIFAFVQIWTGNAKLGLEFTGGTAITLDFDQAVPVDQARTLLAQNGFPDAQIQDIKGDKIKHGLYIRMKLSEEGEQAPARIPALFERAFAGNKPTVVSTEFIGPIIGRELRDKAIWAVVFSTLGFLAYIAFRFDFKFGVAAAIATFHDVFAVLGLSWALGMEFTLLIITALLTIAGYSLTDTVVVFDRIRENLRKHQRDPLVKIINDALNQVLSRTILTSVTTLLAVLVLYLLGGPVLRDFALVLIIGVLVGTYSSIFIASPLLLMWRRRGLTAQVKQ
ncbi:MAG: protein translocase subunit SecF [Candidatus Bipolaricaulota bacterium]|nr:protein translocase subunit SecF [Candidatus Bipolaricaulota bacterium]